jgi:hypothetical protein
MPADRVDSPPYAMRQPVSLVADRECLIEKVRDSVGLRQAPRILVVIFGTERLSHPALELDVREHHAHEGACEGADPRTVGLGKEMIAGEFAKQLHVAGHR